MKQKFPVFASLVCFVAVFFLCALGTWQIQRLQWKNELQHNLDVAFATKNPPLLTEGQFSKIERGQVVRGLANGVLDISKAVMVHGRIENGKSVVAVVAPLEMTSFHFSVPVEIGCGDPAIIGKLPSLKPKDVSIVGVLRQPRWSFVTPPNIPEKGDWWRMNAQEFSTYWKVENLQSSVLTAENTLDFGSALWPKLTPCTIEKTLRNDHASYAFFWFLMAGSLAVIWVIRFLKPYLQSA
jgi:surfeit locus 1 family protein